MTQATNDSIEVHSAPLGVLALQLKAAGMRIVRQSDGRYLILWRHQCVVRDLELNACVRFIDRALRR